MDPKLRVVVRLPLNELWDDLGPITADRRRYLDAEGVRDALRLGARAGALADVGCRLRWLRGKELLDWWKAEARPRLLDPKSSGWRLEDLPNERGWLASEWILPDGTLLLAFEALH